MRKEVLYGVRVLFHSYLRVRFDLPSSINVRDINCVPKLGAQNAYYGSPWRVQSVPLYSTGMLSY